MAQVSEGRGPVVSCHTIPNFSKDGIQILDRGCTVRHTTGRRVQRNEYSSILSSSLLVEVIVDWEQQEITSELQTLHIILIFLLTKFIQVIIIIWWHSKNYTTCL